LHWTAIFHEDVIVIPVCRYVLGSFFSYSIGAMSCISREIFPCLWFQQDECVATWLDQSNKLTKLSACIERNWFLVLN